ncbi:MAG TPA: hypothetical protein VKR61_12885 [Bryobacteraceae bacterium]|nr:hypothetical protein [Bryobacteraceae bacterium]
MHKPYCFAGQPAPCLGYFANDKLPCVCGSGESLLKVLSQVAGPIVPVELLAPAPLHLLPLSA